VISTNFYGDSIFSVAGNGAVIWVVPDAPINIANDAATSSDKIIKITWTQGSSNGGSEIIDYSIYYD